MVQGLRGGFRDVGVRTPGLSVPAVGDIGLTSPSAAGFSEDSVGAGVAFPDAGLLSSPSTPLGPFFFLLSGFLASGGLVAGVPFTFAGAPVPAGSFGVSLPDTGAVCGS